MIRVEHHGDFKNTESLFKRIREFRTMTILTKYAKIGLSALTSATPVDTGKTAASWSYEIRELERGYTIEFHNSNVNDGVNIAVILDYGHGKKGGGYVAGKHFIRPALRSVFTNLADEAWKEVVSRK